MPVEDRATRRVESKGFRWSMSTVNNQKPKVRKQVDPDKEYQVQEAEKWATLDVLGQPAEPICTYYRCHHKFLLHGTRRCRCKHPINKTLGIF